MRKIAIVGSEGFIGKSLTRYLDFRDYDLDLFNRHNPIQVDKDFPISLSNSEVVIWCASKANPITAENSKRLIEEEILIWTQFLKQWQRAGIRSKLILLSSGGCVYSGNQIPFDETSEANGINAYGRLKIQLEKILLNTDIDFQIARLSNVYGPNQPSGKGQGVIAEWLSCVRNGEPIKVIGDLNSFRDYLYIDDLCHALEKLFNNCSQRQIYNISSGVPVTLGSLLDLFSHHINHEIFTVHETKRVSDRLGYFLDNSKFCLEATWRPNTPLGQGISNTITYAQLDEL